MSVASRVWSAILLGALAAPTAFCQDAAEIFKKVSPSVMTLLVERKGGGQVIGTAFLALKDGCAVTAWHVVRDATKAVAKFGDGQEFEVSGLVDRDEKRDLALIRVKVADRPILEFIAADPEVGANAFVIGAPKGLEFSITDGVISQIRNVDGIKQYQFSCPASQGNSGGPLVDKLGKVAGVVSWGLTEGQNLNFAIAATYAKALDASLSTQPWAQVKSSEPLSFATEADDKKAASKLFHARALANVQIAAAYDLSREMTTVSSDRLSIPSSAFRASTELRRLAGEVRAIRFSDPELNKALAEAADGYEESAEGIDDVRAACVYAMRSGWDSYSNSLSNKGFSRIFQRSAFTREMMDKLRALTPASETGKYPTEVVVALLGGASGWPKIANLGLIFDFRAVPTLIVALVREDSPSKKAGFRPSDTIVSVDGTDVSGWTAFEKCLSDNAGKRITVKIHRMRGGDATLRFEVPK